MNNHIDNSELEKSKTHLIVKIIDYVPNAILNRKILKKITGNITVSSFDAGEELAEKTSPFDSYVQIIDGAAEITVNAKKYNLRLGDGIIVPAHSSHCVNATEQFKMISTIIKIGNEI